VESWWAVSAVLDFQHLDDGLAEVEELAMMNCLKHCWVSVLQCYGEWMEMARENFHHPIQKKLAKMYRHFDMQTHTYHP